MSFSSDVKEELARQYSKARHCQIAELSAMIMQEGRISINPPELSFDSENPILVEKYAMLMKRAFDVDVSKPLQSQECIKIVEAIQGLYLEKTSSIFRRFSRISSIPSSVEGQISVW